MKRLLAIVLLACCAAAAMAASMSREEFTRQFAAALLEAMPGSKIEVVNPLQLRSIDAQGVRSTFNLDNAYNDTLRNPAQADAIIATYVAGLTEEIGDGPPNRDNIVPVIKDRSFLDEIRRAHRDQPGSAPMENVFDVLNEDLVIVYAEDTPRNIRYFQAADLEKAGIKREDLRELAIYNLQHILPGIELHQGEHVSMLVAGADYVPSLLLVESLWTGDQLKVDGEFVVAVPTREVLLFTGSKDAAGVAEIARLAREQLAGSSHSLTSQLFVYRDGRFQRFKP